ncbi:hypothetical protein [Lactiplantibacillus mudanjiangensis]|uniref:AbrB family transcriptional regulator [Lactobacillus alimentarius DSM] n=1 Tax=Lactiplantibacillus mudanjiangensis TaxID=1296538 RepID=A0A660E546_9LACO|nr:hypothetical protein [Lactiplantibacillus mudanjiangensis]VDG19664.1 AbrB family transcriptional regulator [Lactobacillus alimentarius DSM] [Lactiplantibacillus mudanjiangensis]VDG24965.1 AbrB family transcriptional regulator [Lactobacillus alimentarius DSM] [Lactiplantibacillus mudanjiangensis]VDG28150.1 AbrB family transcriptional regulator [Lactobacillus alimentarius DSM] [Lactiplantibacillus mudanjiangensis]
MDHLKNTDTKFEKTISQDSETVRFREISTVRPNALEAANHIFDEHKGLMNRLEKL